ncbi:MAG TPA: hypothetical protein DIW31_09285 [Bacteroidales bacterium]|nr:hypothetical protein [Bacteroidales bacterium]
MNTKLKYLFIILILLTLPFGCSKQDEQIVPYAKVSITVNLQLPQFIALSSVNNAIIYPNEGYNRNGVVVYRNSLDEFTAYDATCPKHIDSKPTAVILDDNGSAGTATCPECETVYYFFNYAYPSKGYPLRRYNLTKSGNILYINN